MTHHLGEVVTTIDGATQNGIINLLAMVITILSGMILHKGVETSAAVNNIIVIIKRFI
jgi:amino acid transporter